MKPERVQKLLAQAGIASRRAAEKLIVDGRVRVDGAVVTELGVKADPRKQRIEVNGKRIQAELLHYIVLHKPRAVVATMRDPEGRPTVREFVSELSERVVPVGRLDYHTSGVLLMTNDGDFAARLSHPSAAAVKIYAAKVQGAVGADALERFKASISVDGKTTRPAQVQIMRHEAGKSWLRITLTEGKNRHIHRLAEFAGHPVVRLARLEYAGITSFDLRPGQWRHLTREELVLFKANFGVPAKVRRPADSDVHPPTKPLSPHATVANSRRTSVANPKRTSVANSKRSPRRSAAR